MSWDNRGYIDDLIMIEMFIDGEIHGFGGGYQANNLRLKYEKDYWEIFKELKPDEFKKRFDSKEEEEKKFREQYEKYDEEVKKTLEKAKKEWVEMGGI